MKIISQLHNIPFILYYKFRLICWNISKKYCDIVKTTTKHGIFNLSTKDDFISKDLYVYKQYGLEFILETIEFLRNSGKIPSKGEGVLLDIGANNGVVSIGLLHLGQISKSIAIEPDPYNFLLLQQNIQLNKLENCINSFQYALSDHKGEVQFELSDNNLGDHRVRNASALNVASERYDEQKRSVINVQSDTLDNLMSTEVITSTIDLIWIDVQGFEGYVINGGHNMFSRDIPVVCEIWPYAIKRSGMTQEKFCDLVKNLWKHFYVKRAKEYICYSTVNINMFMDELGNSSHEDVIFTKK